MTATKQRGVSRAALLARQSRLTGKAQEIARSINERARRLHKLKHIGGSWWACEVCDASVKAECPCCEPTNAVCAGRRDEP